MDKRIFLWSIVLLLGAALYSCSTDSSEAGSGMLEDGERIVVGCDTFELTSSIREGEFIYTTPDSFLLGECETKFGTLRADILTQFVCPTGFKYPEGAVIDSICLFMYYKTWHGDGNTPLSINVYEMDGEVLNYNGVYSSGDDVSRFCSMNTCVVNKPRIVVANSPTDSVVNTSTSTYIPFVVFTLTDEFRDRFFNIKDFSSQEAFNEAFKGLYITTEFGGATILHITDINLGVYYHYDYQQLYDTTTIREVDVKGFYANPEVRQINHYELINPQLDNIKEHVTGVDYVVSPGYIFTELNVPIQHMSQTILDTIGSKRPYVNQAKIYVEVLNYYEGKEEDKTRDYWAQPSENMLLIKESSLDRFFKEKELPSDTCAILQSIAAAVDSLDVTHYYYSFDLSTMLTQQLRSNGDTVALPDTLKMVLVPVDITSSTSSSGTTTVTAVKHKQTVSYTAIRSASADDPMKLEVVYSGF